MFHTNSLLIKLYLRFVRGDSRNLQHLLFSKSNLEMITSKSSSTVQSPLSILTISSILCIISKSRLCTLEWILDSGMSGDVSLCNEGECGLRSSTAHFKIEDK